VTEYELTDAGHEVGAIIDRPANGACVGHSPIRVLRN
jgi:hypothetical protein